VAHTPGRRERACHGAALLAAAGRARRRVWAGASAARLGPSTALHLGLAAGCGDVDAAIVCRPVRYTQQVHTARPGQQPSGYVHRQRRQQARRGCRVQCILVAKQRQRHGSGHGPPPRSQSGRSSSCSSGGGSQVWQCVFGKGLQVYCRSNQLLNLQRLHEEDEG
jgi:hypothetical protein